jgi:hypothetical protein
MPTDTMMHEAMITIKGNNVNRVLEGPLSEVRAIADSYEAQGETITETITCQQ